MLRLRQGTDFRLMGQEGPKYHQALIDRAFRVHPNHDRSLPWYKRTEIWKLLKQLKQRITYRGKDNEVQDDAGKIYEKWRRHRQAAAEVFDKLPDLSSALEEYKRNINSIIDITQAHGVSIVFITQPSMWRQNLPKSLSHLLWLGGIGDYQNESGNTYYSVEALASAMEMYNQMLLSLCNSRKIYCLDLAPLTPKDSSAFYDDVHFNEQGARIVAEELTQFLINKEIIGKSRAN